MTARQNPKTIASSSSSSFSSSLSRFSLSLSLHCLSICLYDFVCLSVFLTDCVCVSVSLGLSLPESLPSLSIPITFSLSLSLSFPLFARAMILPECLLLVCRKQNRRWAECQRASGRAVLDVRRLSRPPNGQQFNRRRGAGL